MSGPSGGAAYRGAVSDDEAASLILNDVKVDRRTALVSAFADRIVIVTHLGTRAIPASSIARINHKAGLRTGRIRAHRSEGSPRRAAVDDLRVPIQANRDLEPPLRA